MSDKIKFFALGGLDESGKNMYIVEVNDKIFILDCGLKYPSKNITGVDAICSDMNYTCKTTLTVESDHSWVWSDEIENRKLITIEANRYNTFYFDLSLFFK